MIRYELICRFILLTVDIKRTSRFRTFSQKLKPQKFQNFSVVILVMVKPRIRLYHHDCKYANRSWYLIDIKRKPLKPFQGHLYFSQAAPRSTSQRQHLMGLTLSVLFSPILESDSQELKTWISLEKRRLADRRPTLETNCSGDFF